MRMIRQAISPRLAIRTLSSIATPIERDLEVSFVTASESMILKRHGPS